MRSLHGAELIIPLIILYEVHDVARFPTVQDFLSYIPHISDAIWREFPLLFRRPIRSVWDTEEAEHLSLQIGERRIEDLDDAVIAHQHVPLRQTE